MATTPNPTHPTARRIWAETGGNLDRALDQRDAESADAASPHTGREWAQIEDDIWRLAAHA